MDKIRKILEELIEINRTYALSVQNLESVLDEMKDAKVCTPIIGKFSSGKSAVFNTLLGGKKRLLNEDITPETAVATEIVFYETKDAQKVRLLYYTGEMEYKTLEEYQQMELFAEKLKSIRLYLKNDFMETISDVMLVDMPGFESGLELHNKAIDQYLPDSLAYLIAFPADDMVLRSSIGNILKELCLHEMPLCIVITKSDKVDKDTLTANIENLKKNLKKYIGERQVTYCITSSFEKNAEELKKFLQKIQIDSQKILAGKYGKKAAAGISFTEQYLTSILKNSALTESELAEKEEELNRQMEKLNQKMIRLSEDFEKQTGNCIEGIKADVMSALHTQENTFVMMLFNKQSINEQINTTVRSAVTTSIQKRYLPVVRKYINQVSETLRIDTAVSVEGIVDVDMKSMEADLMISIVSGAAAFLLVNPVIGGIVAFAVAVISKLIANQKREEAKAEIRKQLNESEFPRIVQQIGENVEQKISAQVAELRSKIDANIMEQRGAIEKAIQDVKEQQMQEKQKKEELTANVQKDLEKIEEMKHGLR